MPTTAILFEQRQTKVLISWAAALWYSMPQFIHDNMSVSNPKYYLKLICHLAKKNVPIALCSSCCKYKPLPTFSITLSVLVQLGQLLEG